MINFRSKKLKRQHGLSAGQAGFTLVEMLVAVSIFVIVAFIVISTLLTMSYAYKRAQKMRLLMDNLGFSIQSMSLNIREGVNYSRVGCTDGSCFRFTPIDDWLSGDPNAQNAIVCYSLEERDDGSRGIKKCDQFCPCGSSGSDIVSPMINITKLQFSDIGGSAQKKFIKILVAGEAGVGREYTDFVIQNSVSQRNVDQ